MPKTAPKKVKPHGPSNLRRKHNKWHACLGIPAAIRDQFGGKTEFICVMPQERYDDALYHSRPLVQHWRDQLAQAKLASLNDRDRQIAKYSREYEAARKGAGSYGSFIDIAQWILKDGGLTESALLKANGALAGAVQTAPQTTAALHQITKTQPTQEAPVNNKMLSSYAKHFMAHHAVSHDAAKQASALIEEFDHDVGMTIGQLYTAAGKQAIQNWIKEKARKGQWTDGTIQSKVGRIQTFWKVLFQDGIVEDKRGPFHGRRVPKGRDPDPMDGRRGEGPPFKPEDVPRLWQYALTRWDPKLDAGGGKLQTWMGMPARSLYAAIIIGAFTGIRRTGIMRLTKANVIWRDGVRCIHVREKIRKDSKAGDRWIPIHPLIAALIDELCAKADPYLIDMAGDYAESSRAQYLTSAFGSLVKQLGVRTDRGENLHSIRKNFQQRLQAAGVELPLRKQIFGHKDRDMTNDPDVYGYRYSMAECMEAIMKIDYPGASAPPIQQTSRTTRRR